MARYALISLDEEANDPLCWVITPQRGFSITYTKEDIFDWAMDNKPVITTVLDASVLDDCIIVASESKAVRKAMKLINKEIGNEN